MVLESLATINGRVGNVYDSWQTILHATKNVMGDDPDAISAFCEWSCRADTFPVNGFEEIVQRYEASTIRDGQDGRPFRGVSTLVRQASQTPGLVFTGMDIKNNIDVANGAELKSYMLTDNIDLRKSSWRDVIRTSKILFPDAKDEMIQYMVDFLMVHNPPRVVNGSDDYSPEVFNPRKKLLVGFLLWCVRV